jgi:hypothetical protein
MQLPPLVLQALAFAVDYLKPFGMEAVLQMSNSFRPFNTGQEMALSANTLTYAHPSLLARQCCCEYFQLDIGLSLMLRSPPALLTSVAAGLQHDCVLGG